MKMQSLIEDNWAYIQATATAKAVEIAQCTGRMADVDDFRQDMLAYLVRRADRYDPRRARAKTFINMLLHYGKRDLLRRMYRLKRIVRINTVELPPEQEMALIDDRGSTGCDIAEFIEALPAPIGTVCRQIVLQGIPAGTVARKLGRSKEEIIALVRRAMRPIAAQIGIKAAAVSTPARQAAATGAESGRKPDVDRAGRRGGGPGGQGTTERGEAEPTPREAIPKLNTLSFSGGRRR